jgi:prevent-host-death family protein
MCASSVHTSVTVARVESYGIRDLQRRSSQIVREVEKTGRPALITRHGKVAAVLFPLDADEFEDYVLATAPEFVESFEEAERDLREGRTMPAEEFFAELDREEG